MTLYHGYDASQPPAAAYPGCQVVAGYIGGTTPHIWTRDEWNRASNQGTLRQLPIWVASANQADPNYQANQAALKARELGWIGGVAGPERRMICLDMETSLNVGFIQQFARQLALAGFDTLDYRSISALDHSPSGLMEWAADWSLPPAPWSAKQSGFQYASDKPWDAVLVDVSMWDDTAYAKMGRGLRG